MNAAISLQCSGKSFMQASSSHKRGQGGALLNKRSRRKVPAIPRIWAQILQKTPRYCLNYIRTPRRGRSQGGLRKVVANCMPNLHKIAGISFSASQEGCAKLSQIWHIFERSSPEYLFKCPFSNAPLLTTAIFLSRMAFAFQEPLPKTPLRSPLSCLHMLPKPALRTLGSKNGTSQIPNSGLCSTNNRPISITDNRYHGVRHVYLINSQTLQIGIGIGKFSIINSEELHIGHFLGDGSLKGDRNRYR